MPRANHGLFERRRDLGHDRIRGRGRILAGMDRPPDDQMGRPGCDRLGRRHHPLLIARVRAGRTDARYDFEQGRRETDHRVELLPAADQPSTPGQSRSLGSDRNELGGRPRMPSLATGLLILAGQHGHGQHSERVAGLVHASPQVLDPRTGMHGHEPDPEGPRAPNRSAHGVGNVVQLEVEEDLELGVALAEHPDDRRSLGDEELETDLEQPDVTCQLAGQGQRSAGVWDVEGDDQALAGTVEIGHVAPTVAPRLALGQAGAMPALPAVCSVLDDAVDREWIPGCVARVWRAGALIHASEHGVLATHPRSPLRRRPVQPDTIYDLASVTKVLCTTTLFAQAIDRGLVDLDATLPRELAIGDYRPTLIDLLEHASGLAAHYEFYSEPWSLGPNQRQPLIETVRAAAPLFPPRKAMIYSDLGFLLLGAWLERLHGDRLDRVFEREVANPLGLTDVGFRPIAPERQTAPERVAPTEVYDAALHDGAVQPWYAIRSRVGQEVAHGIVHDDNCVIMGGVAGHAGLFATADATLAIALAWLDGRIPGRELFSQLSSVPGSTRRLGWDGAEPDGSGWTGGVMSQTGFGHRGYTGTSVWIEPDHESVYVLLSNRVHPTRGSDAISDVRSDFHRAATR